MSAYTFSAGAFGFPAHKDDQGLTLGHYGLQHLQAESFWGSRELPG